MSSRKTNTDLIFFIETAVSGSSFLLLPAASHMPEKPPFELFPRQIVPRTADRTRRPVAVPAFPHRDDPVKGIFRIGMNQLPRFRVAAPQAQPRRVKPLDIGVRLALPDYEKEKHAGSHQGVVILMWH